MYNAIRMTEKDQVKDLDQEVIYSKEKMDPHFNYQFIKCRDCGKVLRICQIQRKRIDNCREFVVFTYYCRKCKLTYFIFKFINKKEDLNNGYL